MKSFSEEPESSTGGMLARDAHPFNIHPSFHRLFAIEGLTSTVEVDSTSSFVEPTIEIQSHDHHDRGSTALDHKRDHRSRLEVLGTKKQDSSYMSLTMYCE